MKRREVQFGRYHVAADGRMSFPSGAQVQLTGRLHRLVLELANARGEAVSKEALLARCWPRADVSEQNLTRAVSALRTIFRTNGDDPVESVYGFGYRLKQLPTGDDPVTLRRAKAVSDEAWHRLYQRRPDTLTAAERLFELAAQQAPAAGDSWLGVAESRLIAVQLRYSNDVVDDLQTIRTAVEHTLRVDPDNADARAYLGLALTWMELAFDEAAALLSEAFRRDPDGCTSNKMCGWHQLALGKPLEAESHFRRALNADPGSAQALGGITLCLLCSNRAPEALSTVRSFCQLDVNGTVATGYLALVESILGSVRNAVDAARKFCELLPESSVSHAVLTYALVRAGEDREAIDILEQMSSPSSGYLPTSMVCPAWLAVGDRHRALESLERAFATHCPWLPVMLQDPRNAELRSVAAFQRLRLEFRHTVP